jgi:HSP20 family protein
MMLQRIANSDVFGSLSEMHQFQHQLNRLLSMGQPETHEFPAINIWTSESGAIVRTEIPGINADDVDISLVHDTLTIKGLRNPEATQEGQICHRQERGSGQFSRSIKLPFVVDPDGVKAGFADGVLQIELPQSASARPRKISVRCE